MPFTPMDWHGINVYNSNIHPSTIHTDSNLKWFFEKYLMQEVFSVFEFENVPEYWNMDFFRYVLFNIGFIGVLNTDKFGVIPQFCTLHGRGVYYQPIKAIFSNPVFDETYDLLIGEQCTLIKMQPDYCGASDIINFYASMLALSAESAGVNLMNSKLAYVFMSDGKAEAEAFKKMMDNISNGNPAVFIDKKLFNEDNEPRWVKFDSNLKQNYIASDILNDFAKWKNMFLTDIGIPSANTEKRERLITDEVNSNNIETKSKAEIWRETIEKGLSETNKLFNLNLSVKLRWEDNGNGVTVNTGNLSQR